MDCRKIDRCRLCGSHALDLVIDMGKQCLSGQFPLIGEPDPPSFPLVLVRCSGGCGLVQLAHTVNPELMFREYGYRSGMTKTMQDHLGGIVEEARGILGRHPQMVLDIGCNDGTLLSFLPKKCNRIGIDPSETANEASQKGYASIVFKQPYPKDVNFVGHNHFDLIFTIACFYDSDDPVAFARAVRDNLTPDGIWCVEVAHLPAMLEKLNYDTICHEHLCYYDCISLGNVLRSAGLVSIGHSYNDCNGGSLRVYSVRPEYLSMKAWRHGQVEIDNWKLAEENDVSCTTPQKLIKFRYAVERHREEMMKYLISRRHRKQKVHLLGASTKSNTVLQYAGVDPSLIQYASDRDPRKKGHRTPGTGIPIISEEESRAMRPDVYLSFLGHFKEEIIAREQDYLKSGGKIVFGLPKIEEVGG